jgi:hypothetical protein
MRLAQYFSSACCQNQCRRTECPPKWPCAASYTVFCSSLHETRSLAGAQSLVAVVVTIFDLGVNFAGVISGNADMLSMLYQPWLLALVSSTATTRTCYRTAGVNGRIISI